MRHSVIDNEPYGRFHRKLFVLSSGGPFLDGFILSAIGVAITGASGDLHLSPLTDGLVAASALVGVLLGGLVFGWVTDRVGRQLMYAIDLIVLVIGSVLTLFVTDAWQLVALRLIVGIAVGADYPIATSLLAEWLPAARRGRTMGSLVTAWFVGAAAAYGAGYLLVAAFGDGVWRWTLAIAAVPGLVILLARIGTPESPRWLLRHGRRTDAAEAIRAAFGRSPTEEELQHLAESEPEKKPRLSEVFRRGYLGRTAFVGVFWMCQVLPSFAISTFYPTILGAYGFSSGSTALLWSAAISLVTIVGCIPCVRLVESAGRRPVIIWTFVGVAVPLAALGGFPTMVPALAIIFFCVNALAQGGGAILQWIYPTELFPTDIRASAVGVASAISRVGAAAGTYLMPVGIDLFGLGPTLLIGAGVAVVGTVVCVAWAPETRGRALHESAAVGGAPTLRTAEEA